MTLLYALLLHLHLLASYIPPPASAALLASNAGQQIILASPFNINPETATYQVLASDFSNYKTISVASGTFTITLVASGSQPANGQYVTIVNYGSGVVTVARSGQNINGGMTSLSLPAGTATAPTSSTIWSDGTNYFANVAGAAASGSITISPQSQTCTVGSSCTIPLSAVNPQTATYQVLAADFSAYKVISVASGTFTITLVASGSQPLAGQYITVLNYGSGVVTIARSGQNINGGMTSLSLPAGTATAPTSSTIWSDGTNYFANVAGVSAGGSITISPGSQTCTVGSSCTIPLSAVNAQAATYQVLAADFAAYKTITVASGTFTITLVASGSQPANGQYIRIVNYGTGVVTIAVSGQFVNGGGTSLSLPASSATAPTGAVVVSDGTNYFADMEIAPTNVVTATSVITNNQFPVGNGARGLVGSGFNLGGAGIEGSSSTSSVGMQGGTDASSASQIGTLTLRGGDQVGAGGAGSISGQVLFRGSKNSATNVASQAGTVELLGGQSIGTTNTGLQGIFTNAEAYAQSGTVTQYNLECFTATRKAVTDCAASPAGSLIAGVAFFLSGSVSVMVAQMPSDIPINASAATTVGDTVCAGTTAGQVTDSGGVVKCVTGVTIGTVIAISGAWAAWPDGTAFPTLSSTLPLVHIAPSFN